jgi:negative regulator of replication initiation
MSSKTIAVDSRVYQRLAAAKQEGESFSRVIDRLLTTASQTHTGGAILEALAQLPPLSSDDARVFLGVIEENRRQAWDGDAVDLR